MRTIVSW